MTTIEDYLQGLFAYQFTDQNMTSVLLKREVTAGTDQALVSTEDKELCTADLYMIMFNAFSTGSDSTQRGNWKRTIGGITVGVTDRKMFRDQANFIYNKYGEEIVGSTGMKDGTFLWT
jgi:hypothetical protein